MNRLEKVARLMEVELNRLQERVEELEQENERLERENEWLRIRVAELEEWEP